MADNKRTIATLTRLLKKYGDVQLSRALELEGNKLAGRRPDWDLERLWELYMDVEAARADGRKLTQARKAIATYYGIGPKVVEKRHREACKRFDGNARPQMDKLLRVWRTPRARGGAKELAQFLRSLTRIYAKSPPI
jgi:hypothetical protein